MMVGEDDGGDDNTSSIKNNDNVYEVRRAENKENALYFILYTHIWQYGQSLDNGDMDGWTTTVV